MKNRKVIKVLYGVTNLFPLGILISINATSLYILKEVGRNSKKQVELLDHQSKIKKTNLICKNKNYACYENMHLRKLFRIVGYSISLILLIGIELG